jgi:ferredoxin
MKRKIVSIDESKCNGCGLCINACHEGALQLVDGKAKLISDSYCDGLGNCLPECPTGAIEIIEREAEAFDEEAVKKNMEAMNSAAQTLACGCPGTHARTIEKKAGMAEKGVHPAHENVYYGMKPESQLRQWPCQIKLVPANAPYFNNAHLLAAADCTAYAYANMHEEFMKNKITIIGCPKLDDIDYSNKLADIIKCNNIKSITVARMEVPCCGGIVEAVKQALIKSGKVIPWNIVIISTDGEILDM